MIGPAQITDETVRRGWFIGEPPLAMKE